MTSAEVQINRKGKYKSKLIFINVNGEIKNAIYTIYEEEVDSRGMVLDARVYLNGVDGTFIDGYVIEDRKFVKRYVKKESKNIQKASFFTFFQQDNEDVDCDWNQIGGIESDGTRIALDEVHLSDSGGGGGNVESVGDTYSIIRDWNLQFEGSGSGSHLGDTYGGGGGSFSSVMGSIHGETVETEDIPEDDGDDRIKNELDDTCARNIFTQLENGIFKDNPLKPEVQVSNENGLNLNFSESILKLFNDSQMFNYNIVDGATENPLANADTTPIPTFDPVTETYNITTILNSNYLSNATELSIARTMIHESVHAYLVYVYRTNPIGSIKEGLDRIYQDTNDINITHHQFMGQYVDAIAYSLYDWDLNYGTGGQLGWDYYQAMSWAGMTQYDVFSQIVEDELQREQIEEIILNEIESNTNSNGTSCD